MPDITITDEMVELFARNRAKQAIDPTQVDAYVDGLRNSQGWANVRAGLEAVAPLLRAQWETERAESAAAASDVRGSFGDDSH